MADYSLGYGGVGSGMDITGMVEQLVAADRRPADNRLNRIESQAKFKLSAIGTVSSAFSTLDTALKALKSATAFDVRTVKSATDTVAAASVSSGTPNGTYNVEVVDLATANKWITNVPVAAGQRRAEMAEELPPELPPGARSLPLASRHGEITLPNALVSFELPIAN